MPHDQDALIKVLLTNAIEHSCQQPAFPDIPQKEEKTPDEQAKEVVNNAFAVLAKELFSR